MDLDTAIRHAQKLLRLAEGNANAHEAASAAAAAQSIIDRYRLDAALLEEERPAEKEEIHNVPDPLDTVSTLWRVRLALSVAKANTCGVYKRQGTLRIVGRPSDAATARYLYLHLVREVDTYTRKEGTGCGRVWCNNFRLGMVQEIGERLVSQKQATVDTFRAEAAKANAIPSDRALMRVDRAIELVKRREADVSAWMRENLRLRRGGGGSFRTDDGARAAGRAAGARVPLRASGGALCGGGVS